MTAPDRMPRPFNKILASTGVSKHAGHDIYAALEGECGLSVRHIRHLAEHAATAGVIWPPTLFRLLDDIEKRGDHLPGWTTL
ncbi:MAG: hypothetical protein GDA50_07470 [Alphaproteobacteria bacterium GM202ARS2]|nr:hypothetical protein [Alphaproteobacteria bacterium GM202ARS2]